MAKANGAAARGGLILAVTAALLVWGLSFYGEAVSTVRAVALGAGLAVLVGALQWTAPERGSQAVGPRRNLARKRAFTVGCLLFVASVALTLWPLRFHFLLARPGVERAAVLSMDRLSVYGSCFSSPALNFPAPIAVRENAGLLVVRRARLIGDSLLLGLRRGPDTDTGFLYCTGPASARCPRPAGAVVLGGGWHFVTMPAR